MRYSDWDSVLRRVRSQMNRKIGEVLVRDLNIGDRVKMIRGIGRVKEGDEGTVVSRDGDFQVIIKFDKGVQLSLGDNGTRFMKKIQIGF